MNTRVELETANKPRRSRTGLVVSSLAIVLILAFLISPGLRVTVAAALVRAGEPTKAHALSWLISEGENATPALLQLKCNQFIPQDRSEEVWQVINAASDESRRAAVVDLVQNINKRTFLPSVDKLKTPANLELTISDLLQSNEPLVREGAAILFILCLDGRIRVDSENFKLYLDSHCQDAALNLAQSKHSSDLATFNLSILKIFGQSLLAYRESAGVLVETLEPAHAKRSANQRRPLFNALLPYTVPVDLKYLNTHAVTEKFSTIETWTLPNQPGFTNTIERSVLPVLMNSVHDELTFQLVEANYRSDIYQNNVGQLIDQLKASKRRSILKYLKNKKRPNKFESDLLEFLNFKDKLKTASGTEIVDAVFSTLQQQNLIITNHILRDNFAQRGPDVALEALNRIETKIAEGASLSTIAKCFRFIAPTEFAQEAAASGTFDLIYHQSSTSEPTSYIENWLKHEPDDIKQRFFDIAQAYSLDVSSIAKSPIAKSHLSKPQLAFCRKSKTIYTKVQQATCDTLTKIIDADLNQFGLRKHNEFDSLILSVRQDFLCQSLLRTKAINLPKVTDSVVSGEGRFEFCVRLDWKRAAVQLSERLKIERLKIFGKEFPDLAHSQITMLATHTTPPNLQEYKKLLKVNPGFVLGIPYLQTDQNKKLELFKAVSQDKCPILSACVGLDLGLEPSSKQLSVNLEIEVIENLDSDSVPVVAEYFERTRNIPATKQRIKFLSKFTLRHKDMGLGSLLYASSPEQFNKLPEPDKTKGLMSLDIHSLLEVSRQNPEAIETVFQIPITKNSTHNNRVISLLGEAGLEALSQLQFLIDQLQSAIQRNDCVTAIDAMLALTKIDRSGKTTIPVLIKLAKNNSLSYVYRAIGICGLRRYYYLNRTQTDLKQLIALLNGDLKTLAERSLERILEIGEEEEL